jgi:hypothetical protein
MVCIFRFQKLDAGRYFCKIISANVLATFESWAIVTHTSGHSGSFEQVHPFPMFISRGCLSMKQRALKNVNNDLNTNIYSYLETSGGQSSNL